MGRLIDADALIKDLEYDIELDARALEDTDLLLGRDRELVQFDKDCKQNAIDMLKRAPTVDAVPVIRCKECKYLWQEVAEGFTPYGFYNKRHIFLCQKHFDKYMGELREVMIDDFCSWAERKEE